MTNEEKRQFIRDLTESVTDSVLAKVDRMPDDWTGIELREYLAEAFQASTWNMRPARRREYNTACLTL